LCITLENNRQEIHFYLYHLKGTDKYNASGSTNGSGNGISNSIGSFSGNGDFSE
jgi:hypothetical protein